jgi:DNA repair protein RadC
MTYTNGKVSTWAVEDQPKEKILLKGISTLSDAELLSILVGWGTDDKNQLEIARILLSSVGNDLNGLAKLSVHELCQVEGITKPKAVQIITALEIGRRRGLQEITQKGKIGSSKDVFNVFQPILGDLPYEEFWVLYLNRSNKIIDKLKILKTAIEKLASGLILCHNHPSGNTQPSDPDKKITEKIRNAAQLFECNVLDHIIITDREFYSFADEGIL